MLHVEEEAVDHGGKTFEAFNQGGTNVDGDVDHGDVQFDMVHGGT